MTVNRLRDFIRRYFSRVVTLPETSREAKTTRRGRKPRQSAERTAVLSPSERFVWGMTALIIALIGAIVLEAVHIAVLHTSSPELLTIISGLVGSFTTAFLLGPKVS